MNLEIINLFKKHYNNECSSAELDRVMELFAKEDHHQEWDHVLADESKKVIFENLEAVMSSSEISNLHDRIINSIGEQPIKTTKLPARTYYWKRVVIAASILLVATVGIYFSGKFSDPAQEEIAYANDIAPGKNGATLTLANGNKILINDVLAGNIANQSGVKISKTADGQIVYEIINDNVDEIAYNTLSTTRGEQTQVRLPDGTLVFLNAESSLTYPTSFSKSAKRQVTLTGEGYFEVAKDKNHPFIVKSENQNIEVLGTHFNVNNYMNEKAIKTTLLEGSVSVSGFNKQQMVMLKPGQQAMNTGLAIKVSDVDTELAVAWKNNKFIFENDDIQYIMRMIERWYNVETIYEDDIPNDRFGGAVSRFDNVSEVLKAIQLTGKVHFEIEGRRIIVSK